MSQKILIVDDSTTIRNQLKNTLLPEGFEVLEAVDGLQKAGEHDDIAMMICDVNMPRMNGIEMVTTLLENWIPKRNYRTNLDRCLFSNSIHSEIYSSKRNKEMNVQEGYSCLLDAKQALAEATQGWVGTPDIVFAFCSTKQDPDRIAAGLYQKFPESLVVGCTTAGEHASGKHLNQSLVVAGLSDTGIRWEGALLEDLSRFSEEKACSAAASLFQGLDIDTEQLDPKEHFCLLFVDGLSKKEEMVSSRIAMLQ